jgi:hexulose-6-phosphate isomerase
MKNQLGVMQGRLTKKEGFFPQVFPWDNWNIEFDSAKRIGIESIEWMFNFDQFTQNPLFTENGRKSIREQMTRTQVKVNSVCANYYMQQSLFTKTNRGSIDKKVLEHLIFATKEIGASIIVLPLFERSQTQNFDELVQVLHSVREEQKQKNIKIALEMSEPATIQHQICKAVDREYVGICYDVGNAAGCGYDIQSDLELLKDHIFEIHLKDKMVGGSSVMLGQGAVNFEQVFDFLYKKRLYCDVVLESYFDKDTILDSEKNAKFIMEIQNEKIESISGRNGKRGTAPYEKSTVING